MSIFSTKHSSSAKVVDGSLVLSLPDAITPVVMRLSLEEVKSATLGVEEKDGYYYLIVRFSEKEARDIAPYDRREDAVNALMTASAALERGSRSVNDNFSGGHSGSAPSKKNTLKWLGTCAVLIILVYVIVMINGSMPRIPGQNVPSGPGASQAASAATAGATAPTTTGVPMSADNFLSNSRR